MTTEETNDLPDLIAKAAAGRSTNQAIIHIKSLHRDRLTKFWDYVVDNALINLIKNTKRRKARLVVGQMDLFAPYELPALVPNSHAHGSNERINTPIQNMSKGWLRTEISAVESKPSQKEMKLEQMRRLFEKIDGHCGDDESIEVGLRRSSK